jgi:hypothetical protein
VIGADFTGLLGSDLDTRMSWTRSFACPCVTSQGYTNQACTVCGGSGRYYADAPSEPFSAGFIGQDAASLAALMQPMGPGEVGDAALVLPCEAPCFGLLGKSDRIHLVEALDTTSLVLLEGRRRLPHGAVLIEATVKDGDDAVASVPLPEPDQDGYVQISVTTTLILMAPRSYEVVRDLGRIRTFSKNSFSPLPKRFSLKLLDVTVR